MASWLAGGQAAVTTDTLPSAGGQPPKQAIHPASPSSLADKPPGCHRAKRTAFFLASSA